MKLKFDKLLKNNLVLYLVFFTSLILIFRYLLNQNFQAILFFTLVLFLTKYFSNNMIIILGISLVATALLDLFRGFSIPYLEGMENSKDDTTIGQPSSTVRELLDNIATNYLEQGYTIYEYENKYENVKNLKPIDIQNAKNEIASIKKHVVNLTYNDIGYLTRLVNLYVAVLNFYINDSDEKISDKDMKKYKEYLELLNQLLPILKNEYKIKQKTASTEKEETPDYYTKELGQSTCSDSETWNKTTKKCVPKCANDENFDEKQQKCIAKKDSSSKKESMTTLNPAKLVDVNNAGTGNMNVYNEAKVKELAFDNLDKLFGNDNIRSMSTEATNLNDKQNKIMDQLKDIGPLMNQAMSLIKNVDMEAINNVSSKMSGMINNLQNLKT
tara:strand:- start:103 stop:1257 length:1155 start_codon:yes stop_codon:yes gene_type:complete